MRIENIALYRVLAGRQDRGISTLEILVALVVLSLIAATAMPNFGELKNSFERQAALQDIKFDLRRAKSEALAAGARIILIETAGGEGYTAGVDYLPFDPTGVADEILFMRVLPQGITAKFSDDIIFDSRGFLIDSLGSFNSATINLEDDGIGYRTATIYTSGIIEDS